MPHPVADEAGPPSDINDSTHTSLSSTSPPLTNSTSSTINSLPALTLQEPINPSDLSSQISELTHQLEQLSSKLVRSVETLASLEDELHESRRNNEKLASRNATLELETAQHKEALEGGLLVKRENVQLELQRLTQKVTLESERRSKSEASLSSINQELDDLSASLFTEANRLVATEKLARIQAERKVKEVEEAMKRVEEVIEARRDQLNDLRLSLEAAERDRDHYRAGCEYLRNQLANLLDRNHPTFSIDNLAQSSSLHPGESTAPPLLNPLTASNNDHARLSFAPLSPISGYHKSSGGFQAVPQLTLSHEILPFTEFLQFLQHLRRTREDVLTRPSQPSSLTESYYSAAIAMTSIGTNPHSSNQVIQSSTKETASSPCSKDLLASVLPLSQHLSQPFVKRCLDEDSDPALRLDLAPGLNFISRRPIVTALLEGNLVIEPVWSESDRSTEFDKCTLCGCSLSPWLSSRGQSAVTSNQTDNNSSTNSSTARLTMRKMLRGGSWGFGSIAKPKRSSNPTPSTQKAVKVAPPVPLMRTNSSPSTLNDGQGEPVYLHTFRTTDAASTRYPICPTYCLTRLRSVCHFWTFIRSLERGVLLDESFWFHHHINHSPPSSRFTEVQSLGLAYDSALKSIRQQAQSTDSLHDSPSLTHSDPSSASTSAHTFQSQNQADFTSPLSFLNDDTHGTKQLSPSANAEYHEAKALPGVIRQTSEVLIVGFEQTQDIDVNCDSQLSPLPSPISTSGPDVDVGHSIVQGNTATTLPLVPSPHIKRRSLVRSLPPPLISFATLKTEARYSEEIGHPTVTRTPAQVCAPQKSSTDEGIELLGDIYLANAKDQAPPHLYIPDRKLSLSAPSTTSVIGQRCSGQSRDNAQSSIELLEVGWEGKCWQQVVKLKEEMFLKRVGINLLTS